MNDGDLEFNRGAVRPVQCFREAWQLIKDDYWLFFGITLLGMLIGGAVPFGILLGPMWCGIEICLLRRMRGERINFNYLFEGFNFFGASVVATLFVVIPMMVVILLIVIVYIALLMGVVVPMAQQGGPPDATFFFSFFGLMAGYMAALAIVPMVLGAPLIFMYGLIVERGMSGSAAAMTSIRAVFGNLLGVAGLLLLNLLLSYAGMALLCVGAYLVMPITFAAYAVAYRQVFPHEEVRPVTPVDEPELPEPPPMEPRPATTGIEADEPRATAPETGFTPGAPE
jgi:hypothetical protein